MEIFNSIGNLPNHLGSLFLGQNFWLLQVIEKGAIAHILEKKVKMFLVIEAVIEFDYILLITEALDFDFYYKLLDHEVRFDGFFFDLF
jgi:hypothetical protein